MRASLRMYQPVKNDPNHRFVVSSLAVLFVRYHACTRTTPKPATCRSPTPSGRTTRPTVPPNATPWEASPKASWFCAVRFRCRAWAMPFQDLIVGATSHPQDGVRVGHRVRRHVRVRDHRSWAPAVGFIAGPNSDWHDVKVYQDHCYVVSEGGQGIQVACWPTWIRDLFFGQHCDDGRDHGFNVAIDEDSGFLYRCGGGNNAFENLQLVESRRTGFVGQWDTRYVHDAQIVTYDSGPWAGRQIAFCCSGFNGGSVDTGLDILMSPTNPTFKCCPTWCTPLSATAPMLDR